MRTDNGREYCGKPDARPYELLLSFEDIKHRTTKVRSPWTNGFVERMNRTLLDECFRVNGRTTWYLDPDEIQRDLDRFMTYCNLQRIQQGYRLKGRTPAQVLREALGVDEISNIDFAPPPDDEPETQEVTLDELPRSTQTDRGSEKLSTCTAQQTSSDEVPSSR